METWAFLAVTIIGALATLAFKHRKAWARTKLAAIGFGSIIMLMTIALDVGLLIGRLRPEASKEVSGLLTYIELGLSGLVWAVLILDWMTEGES